MNISILGCGWLGFPLGIELVRKGYKVKGSTTTLKKIPFFSAEGIMPYKILVSSEGIKGDITSFLAETDVLLIDIPPGLRKDPDANFFGGMKLLLRQIEKTEIQNIIFVSSISVYQDTKAMPEYLETHDPNGISESAKQLISSEKIFIQHKDFNTTILRFGGLTGAGRHPAKQLSGRKNLQNPKAPVNLIHQKDCIGILLKIVEENRFGDIFNAVFPFHPLKENYYLQKALEEDLAPPEFDNITFSKGKVISSLKVIKELGYEFKKEI